MTLQISFRSDFFIVTNSSEPSFFETLVLINNKAFFLLKRGRCSVRDTFPDLLLPIKCLYGKRRAGR